MINKNWSLTVSLLSISTAIVSGDQPSNIDEPQQSILIGVAAEPSESLEGSNPNHQGKKTNFFMTADFIYWNAHQDGLDYVWKGTAGVQGMNPNPSQSHLKAVDGKWEPGFKIGIGLDLANDGWDILTEWTWLNPVTSSKNKVNIGLGEYDILIPYINESNPATLGYVIDFQNKQPFLRSFTKGQASWSLHYNVIDLEIGKSFSVNKHLSLRPHLGLKTDWINQKIDKKYTNGSNVVAFLNPYLGGANIIPNGQLNIRESQESWGIGIRTGIDPVWHICRNWGLYGNLALSAIYQQYTTSLTFKVENADDPTNPSFRQSATKQSFHTITPVIEVGLGLEYIAWFYDESYMLELKAGWEEQVWINTNQFQGSSNQGNFSLEGFTFKAGFHF